MLIERESTRSKNGITDDLKQSFLYENLWETPAQIIENPETKKIEKIIPGIVKQEILPYIRRSVKRNLFVEIKAEEVFDEDSEGMEELHDWLKNGKIKGLPHCCYNEEVEQDEIKYSASCIRPINIAIGLDLASVKYRKGACGETHGLSIMGKITDNLCSKSEHTEIINEWEDWDYAHPPIFVTLQKRS